MLRTMRAPNGGPALPTRAIAALVALGLLMVSAPGLDRITHWVLSNVI